MKTPSPIAQNIERTRTYKAGVPVIENRLLKMAGVNLLPDNTILGMPNDLLQYVESTNVVYSNSGERATAVSVYTVTTGGAVTGALAGEVAIEADPTETINPGDLVMSGDDGVLVAHDGVGFAVGIAKSGIVKGYGYSPSDGLIGLAPFDGNPATDAEATSYVLVELTLLK